tara:strand:+ start:251 stop:643 length:393 start_codon:yes stop_codon:yes gene_type:complete
MKTLITLLITAYCCSAQTNTNINYTNPKIQELITIARAEKNATAISVYSLQIQASENPEKILKTKQKYLSKFPNEKIEEIFETPYFKLITGHYLDKKQAEKKLKIIKNYFKSSFVLKREIHIDEFKKSRQ